MLIGVGSVFMKIVNSGGGDDAIISASMNIPGTFTELHDVKEGKMARIENMRVPSKSTVVLKPASLHIMIFKMPKDVKEGFGFTLLLTFEKSGDKAVPLTITNHALEKLGCKILIIIRSKILS
jgi:copper(I)-binding protein